MSKFLRLTHYLFNTNDIHKIIIYENKYIIHIVSKQINGSNFGIGGITSGKFSTEMCEIEICSEKHTTDYNLVTNWINKIK